MTTPEDVQKFQRDGYVIMENFLTDEEVSAMRKEIFDLVEKMDPNEHRTIFTAGGESQFRDDYFLNSVDNVSYFFEKDAFDEEGNLKYDKHKILNKMGHALHTECPSFRKVSFGEKVKNVCRNLKFDDPRICQSMYIFKPPGIGGIVNPHQDATYLHTDPIKVFGIWMALEDADTDNACLWFVPGSHKSGVYEDYRMVRVTTPEGRVTAKYRGGIDNKEPDYMKYGDFVPAPVKKGSVILIDGLVLHRSDPNTSDRSREIYTFHVYDGSAKWDPLNWCQPKPGKSYSPIYSTEP